MKLVASVIMLVAMPILGSSNPIAKVQLPCESSYQSLSPLWHPTRCAL
jgi:hypothetical protein